MPNCLRACSPTLPTVLTASDLITLPYTPDLTRAGIEYACRSLPHTYDRMGGSLFRRLRRIVAGKAVELAFRRHLGKEGVPFDVLGATPFTDPDRYDVALGGRRCDVKSFQIYDKQKILHARRDPSYILEAAALVPSDQLASDHLSDNDVYIFAFVHALVTEDAHDLRRAVEAGQPIYPIYPFPPAWSQPSPWESLGRLALKTNLPETIHLELGGQDRERAFQSEALNLPPRTRQRAKKEFYSLAFFHTSPFPEERLGVYSPRLAETRIVQPEEWQNIWVYGVEIILAGYMTRGEFRRKAQDLPPDSQVLQYRRTRTRNGMVPLRQLRPLSQLFQLTKEWDEYKNVKRDT